MSELVVDFIFKIEDELKINKKMVLDKIFNEYYDRIYKFFIYKTNNKDTSEELTSIVFEKVVVNIDKYSSKKSPFNAWIFTIAKNTMYDYFRTDKSNDKYPIEDYENILESRDNIELEISRNEDKKVIIGLLDSLDERERSIIAYKFGGGLRNTEIAKIMQLSPTNIGSILHRSMNKLKVLLEEEKQ